MKKWIFCLLFLPLFCACDDEDDATPVTLYTDARQELRVYGNEYKEIRITSKSNNGNLTRLHISSRDSERGEMTLLDSALNQQEIDFTYYYKAPILRKDSASVRLTITTFNAAGNTQSVEVTVRVIQRDYLLEELSAITLYAHETETHPNGYCFADFRPLMTSLTDSAKIDLYAYVDEGNSELMTREWRTNTDVFFTRNNNFNYSEATYSSLTASFEAAIGNPRIANLKADDIILFGRGNKALGVIKIIQVYDEPGVENDRYYFNVKRLRAGS